MSDAFPLLEAHWPPPARSLRAATILLALALLIVLGMAWQGVRSLHRSMDSLDWVNQVQTVIPEAAETVADMYAAEAAFRAYAASGDSADRTLMRQALADAEEHVTVLRALAKAVPERQAAVERLQQSVAERRDELLAAPRGPAPNGLVKAAAVREAAVLVRAEAQAELAARDRENYQEITTTRWILWTGLVLNCALVGGAGWFVQREFRARRRRTELLRSQTRRLAGEVGRQRDALDTAQARSAQDADDLHWLNLALTQQSRYNEVIFHALQEGVLVVTKTMRISRVNQAVVARSGGEAAQFLNQPLGSRLRIAGVETEAGSDDPLTRALLAGRELNRLSAHLSHQHAGTVPVLLTLVPLRADDAVIGGVVVLEFGADASRPRQLA